MKKLVLIVLMVFALGGCATLSKPGGPFYGSGQKNKLADALTLLQQGKNADGAEMLAAICKEPPVPGVTDEALFRLSVLRLESGARANSIAQSKRDLDRLVREFPGSSWAPPATALSGFLAGIDSKLQHLRQDLQHDSRLKELVISLTKENRELKERNAALSKDQKVLKESNLSLIKENAELRQNVEKLKYIDLDLERRPRRR